MRLLLDTQTALWAVGARDLLSPNIVGLLTDNSNDVFVSAATVWEIAIKHALRRHVGKLPVPAAEALSSFQEAGFQLLDVKPEHAVAVESLPMLHADPFDRLLVAQALVEPMRLITKDSRLAAYSETIITW